MNELIHPVFRVALRLGYLEQEQLAELLKSVESKDEASNEHVIAALVDLRVIDSEQAGVTRRLADQLPAGASDSDIDRAVIDAFATLDSNLNPSMVESGTDFDTDVDSRLLPSEREQDPYKTRANPGDDPYGTIASRGADGPVPERRDGTRFRVIRKHAEGGLGTVSLAEDVDFRRDVAVKEIKERFADIPDSQSRFIFEAEITGRLEHPGIVPVYALGRHADGRPFYAMRFVTGKSLTEEIAELHSGEHEREFQTRLRSLLNRVQSVCNTIEYAHSRGVVHRDIKPDNIMLGEYGENLVVDWGLAKSIDAPAGGAEKEGVGGAELHSKHDANETEIGSIVGTPYYMSPEQASGLRDAIGPQSDVYSLGATLYQLLTGTAPFRNQQFDSVPDLLDSVRRGSFDSPRSIQPKVPKTLDAICMAAMRSDVEGRYKSARSLASDIERYLADDEVSVASETMIERASRWARKNRSWTMAIAASVIVIAVATSAASVVTMGALNQTEIANERLGNQLSLARLEQVFDKDIVDEEKRQSEPGLSVAEVQFPVELSAQLLSQIEKIESRRALVTPDASEDKQRRTRLLNGWAGTIESLLSRPDFSLALERRIDDEIDRLAQDYVWRDSTEFVDRLAALRERLQKRRDDWRPMEFSGYPVEAFAQNADGKYWRRLPVEFSDDWPILLGDCPIGDVSFEVDFGAAAMKSPVIGLILNADGECAYEFVVADESYDPLYLPDDTTSLAESQQRGLLKMYIIRKDSRGETILRAQPLKVKGELRLRVRRQGVTRLAFSVGGTDIMEFEDPFPLSVENRGRYGVICPTNTPVKIPKVQYHEMPEDADYATDAIRLGDAKMGAGDFGGARAEYAKQPDDIEALFKLALTYEESEEEMIKRLQSILANFSPEGSRDERVKRWYLNAAVRLMAIYLTHDELHVRVGYIQDKLWANYSMTDVQELVPASDKLLFTQLLLKSGQRWRIAYVNEGDAASLRRAIDLFSETPELRRMALWRWCDAVRCDTSISAAEGIAKAIPEMRAMVKEVGALANRDTLEYTTLINDLVWMLIASGKPEEALREVAPLLAEDRNDVPLNLTPLLIEHAKILIALGRTVEAQADLEWALSRIDPSVPQEGIHYAHYSEACGILGILHEDVGRFDEAQKVWLKGRRRNWHTSIPTPVEMLGVRGALMVLEDIACDEILTSWTDGYSDSMYREVVESIFGGSGVDDSVTRKYILHTEKIPQAWIKKITESIFAGHRGKRAGRQQLLRQSTMRDATTYGAMMMLYQAVLQTAFDGDASLAKHPEMDQTLFEQTTALIQGFQDGAFEQSDMSFILGAWTGEDWNSDTFEKLSDRLDDPVLSSSMAMVFAVQMIKHHGKLELGQKVLDKYVEPMKDKLPAYYADVIEETILNAKSEGSEPDAGPASGASESIGKTDAE